MLNGNVKNIEQYKFYKKWYNYNLFTKIFVFCCKAHFIIIYHICIYIYLNSEYYLTMAMFYYSSHVENRVSFRVHI